MSVPDTTDDGTEPYWFTRLNDNYIENEEIFHCPSHKAFVFDYNNISYGFNSHGSSAEPGTGLGIFWGHGTYTEVKLGKVTIPSGTLIIADSAGDGIKDYRLQQQNSDDSVGRRHSEGAKKGLIYEVAIPLKAFEPTKFISSDRRISFAFIINDDDGRGRKWMGIDNPTAIGLTKDLKVFPLLLLKK